jgi:hypothetical protein
MAGQTKRHSLFEAVANIVVGLLVSFSAQLIILPMFGGHFTFADNVKISGLFTVVSLIISYILRRIFNYWTIRK